MESLEVLEARQAQRLEYLAVLQALIDTKQREIENVKASQRFDRTVNRFVRSHGLDHQGESRESRLVGSTRLVVVR